MLSMQDDPVQWQEAMAREILDYNPRAHIAVKFVKSLGKSLGQCPQQDYLHQKLKTKFRQPLTYPTMPHGAITITLSLTVKAQKTSEKLMKNKAFNFKKYH